MGDLSLYQQIFGILMTFRDLTFSPLRDSNFQTAWFSVALVSAKLFALFDRPRVYENSACSCL